MIQLCSIGAQKLTGAFKFFWWIEVDLDKKLLLMLSPPADGYWRLL